MGQINNIKNNIVDNIKNNNNIIIYLYPDDLREDIPEGRWHILSMVLRRSAAPYRNIVCQ